MRYTCALRLVWQYTCTGCACGPSAGAPAGSAGARWGIILWIEISHIDIVQHVYRKRRQGGKVSARSLARGEMAFGQSVIESVKSDIPFHLSSVKTIPQYSTYFVIRQNVSVILIDHH